MAEAMSDERLADIRAQVSDGAGAANIREQWAWGIAAELLAEAERMRDELAFAYGTVQVNVEAVRTGVAELGLRAETAERELAEMREQRDWQPGRWHQVRRPDGSLWMETSDRDEAEAEARTQGWPLYRLWECRETEWRPEGGDRG